MHDSMKRKVLELLENYPINQRKIAVLRYELEHPVQVSPEEMIDAMSFSRGDGQGSGGGHISNKTLYIALNYQEKARFLNSEANGEIAEKLWSLEREQTRLEYYVSLLTPDDRDLIRLAYFEGKTSEEIASEQGLPSRYIRKRRAAAVDRLCELFELTRSV